MKQVSQYEVFVQMVTAMEQGDTKHLKRIDKLLRKKLVANKTSKKVSNGIFTIDEEDASLFRKIGVSVF